MSRRWMTALAVLLGLTVVPAQGQEQIGWAYKLLADNGKVITEHDFGTVPKGAILKHRFPVTNIYAVPLTLSHSVSCDCVSVAVSKSTMESRESGFIDIQMDTRRFNGPKVVSVRITATGNRQYTSTAFLNIKANCRTDVALNPGSLNFGIVPQGQTPHATFDVDYAGVLDWRITGAAASELFRVELAEKYRQPGRVGYRVHMHLKPDAAAGAHKQEFLLTTNDPASPTVPVPFEVSVMPALTVMPNPVPLASAKVGNPVTYAIIVRGSAQKFNVTSIEGLGDGLEVVESLPTKAAVPVHRFTIKWTPAAAGELKRKLTFQTDAGNSATVIVEGTATP